MRNGTRRKRINKTQRTEDGLFFRVDEKSMLKKFVMFLMGDSNEEGNLVVEVGEDGQQKNFVDVVGDQDKDVLVEFYRDGVLKTSGPC